MLEVAACAAGVISRSLHVESGVLKTRYTICSTTPNAYVTEVATISERGRADRRVLGQARRYLEQHRVEARYKLQEGPIVETLLASLEAQASNLLIVGSYEHSPLLEPIFGGVLDDLLRRSRTPLLICQ